MSDESWDLHFAPTRRESRRERRIASRTDRSKYKKTDQEKQPKQTDVVPTGRVRMIHGSNIEVITDSGVLSCSLKGTLKQERNRDKNLLVVGDLVAVETLSPGTGAITGVLPRTSILARQEHGRRINKQLVAANVDQLLIVVSVAEPPFREAMIDRYLIAARKGGLRPAIVINKSDLADHYPEDAARVRACLPLYRSLGVPTMLISAHTKEGWDDLLQLLANKTSVFSGPSGAGKTELANALTGSSFRTCPVRAIGKGAHTTTSSQLIPLPGVDGWFIDTPGIRSLGIFELTMSDLRLEFGELFSLGCLFRGCLHRDETGCAVPAALEEGTISPIRYVSYMRLLDERSGPVV